MARVVLTGAAGRIGTVLLPALRAAGHDVVVSDRVPVEGEDTRVVELDDWPAVRDLIAGADAVAHFGGNPSECTMADLVAPNVVGVHHVLEAAKDAGARRVVMASSNHATGMHAPETRLAGHETPRPDGLYGATKAFMEALGHLYADKFGLEVVCLRIGTFADRPPSARALSTWLSHGDLCRLVLAALDGPVTGCRVVYGASANTRNWWDLDPARAFGYDPQDDGEAFATEFAGEPLTDTRQGVPFSNVDWHNPPVD